MILIGLILVIVGAAILYFIPERWARFAGGVLLVLGLLLVLVGVFDVADLELDDADAAVALIRMA
jgi:uncharacterized membrane protein YfcA